MDNEKFFKDLMTPYHKVLDYGEHSLYIGNQTSVGKFADPWNQTEEDYDIVKKNLEQIGVTSIVCCTKDEINVFPKNFKYLHISMNDNDPSFNVQDVVIKAKIFIDKHIKKGSVIVHCNAGCTRSAITVIYYLMKTMNWDFMKAHKYLKEIRSCINVDLFKKQLLEM